MRYNKIHLGFKTIFILSLTTQFNLSAFSQRSKWNVEIDSANVFSSPRCTDLNKDGIKDIVFGGGIEGVKSPNGIIAVDGSTGKILWAVPCHTQIYTSALFQDINGDGVDDVFIGGRAATFFAINGATGEIIWEFWKKEDESSKKAGWLNFFATQWIEDENKDGFNDLLVMNAGDYTAMPNQKNRPTGRILILSGKNGSILADAKIPENRESYYAPHIYTDAKGQNNVLFGTGGETVGGSLWTVPLNQVMKNDLTKAKRVVSDSIKGFILNSVLADLNNDNQADIINARMNSTLAAIDGVTHKVLWEKSYPGYECYVTPTLGMFNEDAVPDLFTIVAEGSFPSYSSFKILIIDGKNGETLLEENSGFNQFSPAVTADLDNDGIDEILYIENTLLDPETYLIVNQVKVINVKKKETYYLGNVRKGLSMASSPLLCDLDGNGTIELVIIDSTFPTETAGPKSSVSVIELNKELKQISWPGYLGPQENGQFDKK
jgi:hypothetical protein